MLLNERRKKIDMVVGNPLETMDAETRDGLLALFTLGDPDEVGEQLTTALASGVNWLIGSRWGVRASVRPSRLSVCMVFSRDSTRLSVSAELSTSTFGKAPYSSSSLATSQCPLAAAE